MSSSTTTTTTTTTKPSLKRSSEHIDGVAVPAGAAKKSKLEPVVFYSKSKDPTARLLSNFAPSWIKYAGRFYPTVEHLYQSMKSDNSLYRGEFSCWNKEEEPWHGMKARKAKWIGSKESMKKRGLCIDPHFNADLVMRHALQLKFDPVMGSDNGSFAKVLESTGDRPLRHFSRNPGVWSCRIDKVTGEITAGGNKLGKMLEELRAKNRLAAAAKKE